MIQWNYNHDTTIFILENIFENTISIVAAIFLFELH